MSRENIDAAQTFVDAVNRGDVESAVRACHPALIFEPLRAATEGAYLGRDGFRRFLTDTASTFEVFRVEHTDIRDLGDRVVAIGSIRIRGRASGVETDIPTASITQFRDRLIWRYKDYGEARLAFEAAGLRE